MEADRHYTTGTVPNVKLGKSPDEAISAGFILWGINHIVFIKNYLKVRSPYRGNAVLALLLTHAYSSAEIEKQRTPENTTKEQCCSPELNARSTVHAMLYALWQLSMPAICYACPKERLVN